MAGALRACGVLRWLRWRNRHRLIILTYHGVLPAGTPIESYESRNVVDLDAFTWQMRYLARHYRCISLAEAVDCLASGRPLPPYALAVTFDDGFRNNLRHAWPVLRRFQVPATIFLTTGHVDRGLTLLWTEQVGRLLGRAAVPQTVQFRAPSASLTLPLRDAAGREDAIRTAMNWLKSLPVAERREAIQDLERRLALDSDGRGAAPDPDRYTFLSWAEARELARGGVTIGSHTVHHPILSSLDDDARVSEVAESKREIEARLGAPCTLFSYPNGTAADFDDRDQANLRAAGYAAAVSQISGLNDGHTDRYALRRLNIGRGHTRSVFVAQVSGFWPWLRAVSGRAGRPQRDNRRPRVAAAA